VFVCSARGIAGEGIGLEKAGRHPVYTNQAKWSRFETASFATPGTTVAAKRLRGLGTVLRLPDGNVTTWRMRHALRAVVECGERIRNSTFHGSGRSVARRWTNENLFENWLVEAAGSWGTYGNEAGIAPQDEAHGPEGLGT